ncbi:hypothetical protein PR202_gb23250 [Eleusine coracana subsp. coracana]|uniref:DNA mismatch repair protein S5 domain-containing protein n=1 Tax=Eleusine coracana subsp. coracana TaxID=191504 RepID=A0AAV5FFS2_ELECO|nr:hypothetical protein PR202_gb23250 [Eleusine coracana subsp. coracana]
MPLWTGQHVSSAGPFDRYLNRYALPVSLRDSHTSTPPSSFSPVPAPSPRRPTPPPPVSLLSSRPPLKHPSQPPHRTSYSALPIFVLLLHSSLPVLDWRGVDVEFNPELGLIPFLVFVFKECMNEDHKALAQNVHSSLRSSIILSDLTRVVEELIYNSIDANARKIDIAVNLRACYVKVEDDGCGITRDELVLLGEKYATSKSHSVMDSVELNTRSFGLNGEALASLSDISVVEGSRCLHLGIDDQREVVGTTVVVRELFYNQPVRRKQMHSREKRELHNLKKCALQIALIHPLISIRLLDIDREDELLCTAPSSSPLPLISKSFGDDVSKHLHEIAASEQDWVLSGHISGPTDVFCTKNEEFDVRSTKRQKINIHPAYLLNIYCPRSSYDLHFEPTKTIVEFKDWQTVLFFIEQTVTNYWKKHALQSPKDEAYVDDTDVPLKKDVKLNQGIVKHHNGQKKEDFATFHSAQHKSAVRDTNFDMGSTEALKDSFFFSFDVEPSLRHTSSSRRIVNASKLNNSVTSIDYKFGRKQIHSPESGNYPWLEDGSPHLEDGIPDVNSTSWQMQRTEGIFQEYAYSGNFGMLEDVPTEGFLAHEQEPEFVDPEIKIQEPCFRASYKPNRMTCDYVQNQTNMFTHTSGRAGLSVKFDKLIESCLVNEGTHEISQLSDELYHDYSSTSRGFCGVLRKCSTNTKLEIAHPSVEGLEADTISKMNFPDIHPMWSSDVMDRSSIKDTFHHFSHPFSSLDTPFSQARTDLKCQRKSNKNFDFLNFANINSEFGFTLDRFNNDSSIICETKHSDNSEFETQWISCSNNDCCSRDQFGSEYDLTSWKPKLGARLSDDISRVESANACHLNVSSFQMANGSTAAQDLLNQHSSRCNQRSRLSKDSRSRRHSAPPFYRGKQKFTILNEPLSKSITDGDKDICSKNQEGTAPKLDISHVSATQSIPETDSSELSDLNFSSNGYVKMCEDACSDGLEDTTAQITKWRDDSGQQTALDLPQGPLGCCDDVLGISSGTLQLSYSSLVPESVNRNCFEEARVLMQLDKKFIPVISGETILLVDQLDETDGSSAIPPAVLRVLNFKACRGAIMFGDALLPSECCLIIEELKETSLCLQCAHGRPTTVPILNIASLHDELGRLEMLSGRQTETWHGLAHQGPSLERARTRPVWDSFCPLPLELIGKKTPPNAAIMSQLLLDTIDAESAYEQLPRNVGVILCSTARPWPRRHSSPYSHALASRRQTIWTARKRYSGRYVVLGDHMLLPARGNKRSSSSSCSLSFGRVCVAADAIFLREPNACKRLARLLVGRSSCVTAIHRCCTYHKKTKCRRIKMQDEDQPNGILPRQRRR